MDLRPLASLCRSAPWLVALLACSALEEAGAPRIDASARASTRFELYFAPAPAVDVESAATELLDTEFAALVRTSARSDPGQIAISIEVIDLGEHTFSPPHMDILRIKGRGISREEALAMQTSQLACALSFEYAAMNALEATRVGSSFAHRLARRTRGLIQDAETREVFSPGSFAAQRMQADQGGFPDVRRHITIHAYEDPEFVRAITLGMAKFGLPDLVVSEFSWELSDQIGHAMNLLAQALVEGATPPLAAFDLDVSTLRNPAVREGYEQSVLAEATPVAQLALRTVPRDDGDPDNRLVEILFDRYEGETVHERQERFASSFLGFSDPVQAVEHDEAILAASRRAREKLPTLREAFRAGLEPGETILLKAPFDTPDGDREWMWIEVVSWSDRDIRGLLRNEPRAIPALHAGETVRIEEDEVFDYIRSRSDGTSEGNETGEIMERAR